MQDICCKFGRAAAIAVVLMAFAGSAWAGGRWHVGDVIVCFGGGTCQVVRTTVNLNPPNTVQLLDQLSDSTNVNPGDTRGVAINNTLHVLVTDATSGNNQANVVEYQIAGEDPSGNPVPHGVSTVFNLNGPGNAQAIALDSGGNMFVLNSMNPPSITKIEPVHGNATFINLTGCPTQVAGMDLSADGSTAYLTSGGTIQKVNLSAGTCTPFADFGSGVSLFGIRDIPAGALSGNCRGNSCTADETVLVVAKGFIDPSAGENEGASDASDAVNVCTNQVDQTQISCALLLDTQATGPGLLTTPTWQAGHLFANTTILDPFLQVQNVSTPGTSGADEPTWSHSSGKLTTDNAVTWTDRGQKLWQPNFAYAVGNIIVDPAGHVQQVIAVKSNNLSGSTQPVWNESGGTTKDNKVTWQDRGGWLPNHAYALNAMVGSPAPGQHLELATVAGVSGPAQPTWTNSNNATIVDGLQWLNGGQSRAVIARYPVINPGTSQPVSTLQALSLDPLLATPTSSRQVSNFWVADSISGNFFRLDFATGSPQLFSTTVPTCTGCNGIQGIGVYGAEDSAQPALVDLQSQPLTGPGTTNQAAFTFNPDGNDSNQLLVTGYNFINNTPVSIHGYASAINPASGFSDQLLTPTPPPNNPVLAPPAPCTPTAGTNCVVWQLDNDAVQQNPNVCTPSNPANCAFLGLQLEYPGATQTNPNFNVIAAIDEQYDVTDSVDTISHYTNSQVSLHNAATVATNAACTYGSPLSPSFSSPATCLTDTRNNIPFKFQCTNLPSSETQANMLPFLHIVQSVTVNNVTTEEPLLVLNGTGGTTNYRFDTTGQQWVFNLNNPGDGQYLACTEDATHTVPAFCTFFNVQPSCP